MKIKISQFIVLIIAIIFSSCNDMKDKPAPVNLPETPAETGKMFILSEGLFNNNNSTLGCINFENHTFQPDLFGITNGRGLGDTANDMKRNGNYLWIVVNVSSQIEVVDIFTGISVRRIPVFDDNGIARQPRFITFLNDKAYVCCFDGTVCRIDIPTLKIDAVTTAGRNPDGICITNNKLYVSNSGGLDMPNYDNTVSVIDLETFEETKKITVGINPFTLQTDSEGDIYVISRGNNSDIKASICRINSLTDQITETFTNLAAINLTVQNDTAYLYNFDFVTNDYSIKTFDCKTEQVISENFITDNTTLTRPFGIAVHPQNRHVYLTDANNYTTKGSLYCFDRNGKLVYQVKNVGLNPNTILLFP